ncbi:hypothetical protein CEQ18_000020 [Pseudomonas aeruginosa]|nr:hypothetical protein CEQ18_000020 [Pseudomonas aeruginosa]
MEAFLELAFKPREAVSDQLSTNFCVAKTLCLMALRMAFGQMVRGQFQVCLLVAGYDPYKLYVL